MEHKIVFLPADDRTDPDPNKNYGVSDVNIKFLVIGNKGIVEFDLHTNWYLPHVMNRRLENVKRAVYQQKEDYLLMYWIKPFPADVCYYSLERVSEEDTHFEKGWSYVFDHKPCFYGYRYKSEFKTDLWTTDYVYNQFLIHGDSEVWAFLDDYYIETFGKDDEQN